MKFEQQQVTLVKRALAVGHHAVEVDGAAVGGVERKRLDEPAGKPSSSDRIEAPAGTQDPGS